MTIPKNDLTRDRLVEVVLYDPIDGRWVWRYSVAAEKYYGQFARTQ